MIICLADVLPQPRCMALIQAMQESEMADGRDTAGWHAKLVKNNRQWAPGPALQAAQAEVVAAFDRHPVFKSAVQPKAIRPPLFSRYEPGMSYGDHVDDALMGGQRVDLSITLFLSPPESYEGGELVLEQTAGDPAFKLPAGAAVIYPATSLHRVLPVQSGVRSVAVTWAQSLVRSPQHREMLFDLDQVRRALFDANGKSRQFDLLSKTHANLLRLWAEP